MAAKEVISEWTVALTFRRRWFANLLASVLGGKLGYGKHDVCSHCGKQWPTISEMGLCKRSASLYWYKRMVVNLAMPKTTLLLRRDAGRLQKE